MGAKCSDLGDLVSGWSDETDTVNWSGSPRRLLDARWMRYPQEVHRQVVAV